MTEALRKITEHLSTEEGQAEFLKAFQERERKALERDKAVIAKYYPEHVKHEMGEVDYEYFDAMFMCKDVQCSCGTTLKLEREMYEDF